MVPGELRVVPDVPAAFAEYVVDAFAHRTGEYFSLAASGGKTARRCYEQLADTAAETIDWWAVDLYWGDERCVPADSPDSNERLVRDALLERVGAAHTVHPMRCADGPEHYQLRIGEVGRIDVIHLGMGPDGHTASLFPGSPALAAPPGRLVVMNADPSGRNPFERMTFTFDAIARGRLVVVTVEGEDKREALQAIHDGADLPAARIGGDRVVWLVDPAAAPT